MFFSGPPIPVATTSLAAWFTIFLTIVTFAFRGLAGFMAQMALTRIANNGIFKLRTEMFQKLQNARMQLFSTQSASTLANTVVYEVQTGSNQLVYALLSLTKDGLTVVFLLGIIERTISAPRLSRAGDPRGATLGSALAERQRVLFSWAASRCPWAACHVALRRRLRNLRPPMDERGAACRMRLPWCPGAARRPPRHGCAPLWGRLPVLFRPPSTWSGVWSHIEDCQCLRQARSSSEGEPAAFDAQLVVTL